MLKKTLFALLICSFFAGGAVFAEDSSSVGILPNSPFYFIKDIGREIQSFLTFNIAKKAELSLETAEEKLAEIEALSEQDPDNVNYNEYLEKYQDTLAEFQDQASVLVQDSDVATEILESITENNFDHQARLEQLRERIKASELDNIKDNVIQIYTDSSLEVASLESIEKEITSRLKLIEEDVNTNQVLTKIKEFAPILIPYINRINAEIDASNDEDTTQNSIQTQLEGIVTQGELIEKMKTEASNLGITPEEIMEEMGDISEEDKEKLQSYAINLLTGNKTPQEIVKDIQEMQLSTETQQKLDNLQQKAEESHTDIIGMANPASVKCTEDGYTLELREDEDGNQYGMCIADNGNECDEWKYFRGECSLE